MDHPVEREVTIGVVAGRGTPRDLAEDVAGDLPDELADRHPEIRWRAEVRETDPAEPSVTAQNLIESLRRTMLDEGWDLAVGLTDLPLRSGSRPVTALASPGHGVGLVSVPAFGALRPERRLKMVVADLVEGLLGESAPSGGLTSELGRARMRDDGTIKFVGDTLAGNLRLLTGMVRANRPSRVVVRLSKAVLGALGVGAFALTSVSVWLLADGMTWPRLLGVTLFSIAATCFALVLAHGLWERTDNPTARERVALFNLTTVITIAIGALSQYVALFTLSLLAAAALIPAKVLERNVDHAVGIGDYLQLAWLVASLATIGGALGSMVESNFDVRDAAYQSYRSGARAVLDQRRSEV
jgi:uncharacterized membrane protein